MNKTAIHLLYATLLALVVLCPSAEALDLYISHGGSVPCGTAADLYLSASDYDWIGHDEGWFDTITFTGPQEDEPLDEGGEAWPCAITNEAGEYNGYCNTVTFDVPTRKFYVVYADDAALYEEDGDVRRDLHQSWIGVGSLDGPEVVCVGQEATYGATTAPSTGYESWLEWSNGGGDSESGVGSFATSWSTAGTYTVTVSCGTHSKSKTVTVVAPSATPILHQVPCDSAQGGGCGGGSCASGGGFGGPSLRSQSVAVAAPLSCPTCPPACFDNGSGSGCDNGVGGGGSATACTGNYMWEWTTCGGSPVTTRYYRDSQGRDTELGSGSTAIGNGESISADQDGGYTLTKADGTLVKYSPPVASGGVLGFSRMTSITDPDGRVTTLNRDYDGNLDSIEMPNTDLWTYEHNYGGGKITKATAPDGTYTEVDYVDSGAAAGMVASVRKYDGVDPLPYSTSTYAYTDGRLTSATVNGHVVIYSYDTNLIVVTDTSADPDIVTTYAYNGDTTTVTRRYYDRDHPEFDEVTEYHFFTKGGINTYLWKVVTDPQGVNATTRYGVYVPSGTDTTGKTPDVDYDAAFILDPPDNDLLGKVFQVEDPLHRVIESSYDSGTGALLSVTYPEVDNITPTETYWYYGSTRWLKTVENVRGNFTHYERDSGAMQRVTEVKVDDRNHTDTEWAALADHTIKAYTYYDPNVDPNDPVQEFGLLKMETVPAIDGANEYYKKYTYLNGSRLEPGPTSVTYRWGDGPDNTSYTNNDQTEHTEYDIMGRVLSSTDANSRTIWNTYDAQGRQLQTIYAKSGSTPTVFTQSEYSPCCGLRSTTDEEGRSTFYTYDAAKRVMDVRTSAQSENETLVHYTYDCFGNVATVTTYSDANTARTTAYTYDLNNRVILINYPGDLGDEEFQYDAVGNLVGKMDGEAAVTAYQYDDANRLVAVKYNYGTLPVDTETALEDPEVTYTYYDGSRLRHTMTDLTTGESHYTYDLQDRLDTYSPGTPADRLVDYDYNNLGQKTAVTLSEDNSSVLQVTYDYYANGWLKQVNEDGIGAVSKYTYDEVGNRTRVDLHNGTYTTYDYSTTDPRYFVEGIGHWKTGSPDTELGSIAYTSRDDSGNPLSVTYPSGTVGYTYDNNNRLDSETGFDYNYDWVGNRLNPPDSPDPMDYNDADQLTRFPAEQGYPGHQYDYLGTGSLEHQYDDDSPANLEKTFEYTPANLLSSVTHVGAAYPSEMAWDAGGNRVSFTSSEDNATTEFVYDVTAGIPAVIEENDGTSVYYVREPGGELIARIGTGTQYYHFDALGSTRILTDYQGNKTDAYAYDAWGQLTDHTAYTGSVAQPYLYVGELGYYSHYQDENLGLLQLGVRFYDATTGRFTQADAIRNELEAAFLYAGGRAMSVVDPTGYYAGDEYASDTRAEDADFLKRCNKKCREQIPQGSTFAYVTGVCGYFIPLILGTELPGVIVGAGGYVIGYVIDMSYRNDACEAYCNDVLAHRRRDKKPLPNPAFEFRNYQGWFNTYNPFRNDDPFLLRRMQFEFCCPVQA